MNTVWSRLCTGSPWEKKEGGGVSGGTDGNITLRYRHSVIVHTPNQLNVARKIN